ncbi:MAG: hypothetical protein ACYCQJ_00570 [Nitrososphaerales archaeon]
MQSDEKYVQVAVLQRSSRRVLPWIMLCVEGLIIAFGFFFIWVMANQLGLDSSSALGISAGLFVLPFSLSSEGIFVLALLHEYGKFNYFEI